MNEFKEEFSQLLLRYASTDPPDDTKSPKASAKLSNQQILSAVHEVLHSTLNINLQNVESAALKTPANEIVVATPDAPDVFRQDYNLNNTTVWKSREVIESLENLRGGISDSFETLVNSNGLGEQKATIKEETSDDLENQVKDSDFGKENNLSDFSKLNNDISDTKSALFDKNLKAELIRVDAMNNHTVFKMVEEVYQSANINANKLLHLRQLLTPESWANRRLSTIMQRFGPSSKPASHQQPLHQNLGPSSNLRSIQRAKALRRSLQHANCDDIPVTPTTSRPSLGGPPTTVLKKPATTRPAAGKLASQPASLRGSMSSLNSIESSKSNGHKSPPSKKTNSRYAHVQSTIPKPTASVAKRKAA